jgi:hypothetical protein
VSGTGGWLGIVQPAEALNWYIGVWNELGYANPPTPECKTIPPLGERSAEAIKGAHDAVRVIDEIIRELHAVRSQLSTELRTNEDELNRRVDAMLAKGREACAEGTLVAPPEAQAGDDTTGSGS